jgi:hypothetical protein
VLARVVLVVVVQVVIAAQELLELQILVAAVAVATKVHRVQAVLVVRALL